MTKEDIEGAVEKFGKWVKTLENRLASLDGVFFGANSINVGDFMLFGIFSSTVRNKSANSSSAWTLPSMEECCLPERERRFEAKRQ